MYKERGYPCTVGRWYVSGGYVNNYGGGILEWCTDENDARSMLAEMKESGKFIDLAIGYWQPKI